MAVGALFGDVGMLVDEGPLVFHVASSAQSFGRYALEILAVGRKVRVMAVSAGHLVFRNGVMRKLRELYLDLGVAAGAELFLVVAADFLLRPFMQLVAVKAADIVESVRAGVPAGQVWSGCCRMAMQAEH